MCRTSGVRSHLNLSGTLILSLSVFVLFMDTAVSISDLCPEVDVDDAQVFYSSPDSIQENTVVNVTCNPGFVFENSGNSLFSMVANCTEAGNWSTNIISCIDVVCPAPPAYDFTFQTFTQPHLNDNSYGQIVEYRCQSGKRFETDIRPDGAEKVTAQCNQFGQWSVVGGAVQEGNEKLQYECRGAFEYEGCYDVDLSAVTSTDVIDSLSDAKNIQDCRNICKANGKTYAALQVSKCRCVSAADIDGRKVSVDNCRHPCVANSMRCGGDTEHSVFKAIDSCISISGVALGSVSSRNMYNSDTCVQYCRGRDEPIAFYQASMRQCYCLNAIPDYNSINEQYCNTAYSASVTFSLDGYLLDTDSATVDVHSCADLFDMGVFYHGNYYTPNGTKIHCHFFDNSAPCDEDWIAYNGHCYHYEEHPRVFTSQADACRNKNSLLISVGDSAEWAFMNRMAAAMSHTSSNIIIGLYDIHDTFTYQWADETAFTYRPFSDNYPELLDGYRRCEVYYYQLRNAGCTSNRPAFCEKSDKNYCMETANLGLFTSPAITSPSMSVPLCFETCRGQGDDLAVLNGTQCYCFTDAALGFNEVPMSNCDLPCEKNPIQICGSTSYNYFFVTRDVGQPLRESCDAMILDGLATTAMIVGHGTPQNCADIHAASDCSDSWLPIGDGCYRTMKDPSSSASQMCTSMGGYLAVFETSAEMNLVSERLQATPSLAEISHWIGGLGKAVKNVTKITYSNGAWVPDEILQAAPQSTKIQCFASDLTVSQEAVGCSSRPYLCEMGDDYLGCYKKTSPTSGYLVIQNYELMNLRQCRESCRTAAGYTLYGVTMEPLQTCYCLKPDEIEKQEDFYCTAKCAGHQACGGEEKLSVYSIATASDPVVSSCRELYDQGVLLPGVYKVLSGYSLCRMPDFVYSGDIPFQPLLGSVDWVMIGEGSTVFKIDVTQPKRHASPGISCLDILIPGATTVASIRTPAQRDLLIDFLNWSVTGATWTVIGLVDQFLTGTYTWADGYLYRPGDVNLMEELPPLTQLSRAGYATIDHFGGVSALTDEHNVACMLDTHVSDHPECYAFNSLPGDNSFTGYQSMSVTLCRQFCQQRQNLTFYVSSTDCTCEGEAMIRHLVNVSECSKPCPGNSLQLCGATGSDGTMYFKKYTFEAMDLPSDCSELYDNFIVRNGLYRLKDPDQPDGSLAACGLEDETSHGCPAGFLSRGNKCLRFTRLETYTIREAAQECFNLNSRLASLLTPGDLDIVPYITSNISSLRTAKLWAIGHYSALNNGHYVDSMGHLIPPNSDILNGVTLDEQCMAVDTENRTLVAVSCDSVLPFICEYEIGGLSCVSVYGLSFPYPDLVLPTSMTIHQCNEICKEKEHTYFMVQGGDCFCDLSVFSFDYPSDTCNRGCPNNPFQLCGSNSSYTLYSQGTYLDHHYETCDELLDYGITARGTYIMANGDHVTCFKYTNASEYIMANNEDITVTASSFFSESFTSADAKMDILTLTPGGWAGGAGLDAYSLQFDLQDVYLVQGIVMMTVPGHNKMTSLSIRHELYDSYSENYQLNPVAITYPPESSMVWIDIEIPFVARRVVITFNAWDGPNPGCSFEFIGYKFYEHWTDTQYLGVRGELQNASTISPTFSSDNIETCVETCRTYGFRYFMISASEIPDPKTGVCLCLDPSISTRDFYTGEPNTVSCMGSKICSDHNEFSSMALYSTYAPTCRIPTTTATSAAQFNTSIQTQNSPSSSEIQPIGTRLSVTCDYGYASSHWNGTLETYCANYGLWYPPPVDLTCEVVDCGSPSSLTNMTLVEAANTTFGSVATYQCETSGYLIDGTSLTWEVECAASGLWLPETPPACIPKLCPTPTPVSNSYLVHKDQYLYGDVALMKCDAGSVFDGTYITSHAMTCQIDGTWDFTPSVPCRALECPPTLPAVSHAYASLQSDLSGLYECNGGRHFPDKEVSKTVLCDQQTNQWSTLSAADVCQKSRTFGTNICLVQTDKCLNSNVLNEVNARSLLDCAVACSNIDFCRSVCYQRSSKFLEGAPNCQLVASGWDHEHEIPLAGWDFYDTFGAACS